jgi:hypothetical protein
MFHSFFLRALDSERDEPRNCARLQLCTAQLSQMGVGLQHDGGSSQEVSN